MSTSMFRGRALQRISSPEHLDQAVRSARPLQWVALGTLLAVVAATIVWSAVVSVPTTIPAQGFYLPPGGLFPARTPMAGILANLSVLQVGARVTAGETLATVTVPTPAGAETGHRFAVTAPQTGTVIDVSDESGTYQGTGETVAVIEPTARRLVVYAYLPTEQASRLRTGGTAQVIFGADLGATFGSVRGHITSISRYPVDTGHIAAMVAGTTTVQQVAALGPANEVIIALASSSNRSGLVWASGKSPPGPVAPGTPCSVAFVVGHHHPINNVL